MKSYLDGICSIDLPSGPPELPDNPHDCWIIIQADIGPEGEEGLDIFTFYVCTVEKLKCGLQSQGFQLGHHLILIERFDWQIVENAIKSILDKLVADNWDQLAAKINEYGEWEYNAYKDEPVP